MRCDHACVPSTGPGPASAPGPWTMDHGPWTRARLTRGSLAPGPGPTSTPWPLDPRPGPTYAHVYYAYACACILCIRVRMHTDDAPPPARTCIGALRTCIGAYMHRCVHA